MTKFQTIVLCIALIFLVISGYALKESLKNSNTNANLENNTNATSTVQADTELNWPTQNQSIISQNSDSENPTNTVVQAIVQNSDSTKQSSSTPSQMNPIEQYANDLGSVYENYYAGTYDESDAIDSIATSSPNQSAVGSLETLAQVHQDFSNSIKKIVPPESMSGAHTELASSSDNLAKSVEGMAVEFQQTNSVPAQYFENYNQAVLAQAQALIAIATIIKNANISFSDNENGLLIRSIVP